MPSPLEEQVEKLAWEWGESAKQLEALARSGGDEESAAWVAGASAAREEDIDDLRTLLPLEVTDEGPLRVTVDTADLYELLYGATTDSPANRKARTRLRAALTQKGEA